MKKPLLLLLLLVLLVLSVPELREFAAPVVDPAGELLVDLSEPLVQRVKQPFMRWKAEDEARALANLLRETEAIGGRLPRPSDFQAYLRRRWIVDREGLDPWGEPFQLEYTSSEVVVVSAGPDRTIGTADDIRVGFARRLN